MSKANSLEWQMLDLINEERTSRGLNPLRLELRLNDAAEDHSQWMIDADKFSHTGAGGSSHTARVRDANFDLSGSWRIAENIAWQSVRGAPGLADDVINLHDALMNSSGHRANILNPNLEVIGIGIERGDYKGWDGIFVTQNFAATDGTLRYDSRGTTEPDPLPPQPVPPSEDEDQNLAGTGGNDKLKGQAGNDTLTGNGGNDTLLGGGDDDRLNGNAGHDKLKGGSGDDELRGGSGQDKLIGNSGNDRLFGDGDNDTLKGGSGNDQLYGGAQDDSLNGGSGNDTLDGGQGNDVLKGGSNTDVFVFANGHGHDRIADFNAKNDLEKIDLSGLSGFDDFQDVQDAANQTGRHVTIDTGDDSSILLSNVALKHLDASDFLF